MWKHLQAKEDYLRSVGEAVQASAKSLSESLTHRVDARIRDTEHSYMFYAAPKVNVFFLCFSHGSGWVPATLGDLNAWKAFLGSFQDLDLRCIDMFS